MATPDRDAELRELKERVTELTGLVCEMRQQLEANHPQPGDGSFEVTDAEPAIDDGVELIERGGATAAEVLEAAEPTTRRGVMRAAGAATVGVVAGALLHAKPAAALDPNDVVKGTENRTSAETEIRLAAEAPAGHNVFFAQSTNEGTTTYRAAVAGSGGDHGVYNGVYGHSNRGSRSTVTGHAIVANAQGSARSNLAFVTSLGPPRRDAFISHARGEVRYDTNGDLWFCTTSGNPGTWKKLSGPAAAGSFHLLAAPERAYDSRVAFGGTGPVAGGATQAVNVKTTGVPTGFTGVLCNLTVVSPIGPGFAVLYADGQPQPPTSSVNYDTGEVVGNNVTTAVSASGMARFFTFATTEYVVDVMGYYR